MSEPPVRSVTKIAIVIPQRSGAWQKPNVTALAGGIGGAFPNSLGEAYEALGAAVTLAALAAGATAAVTYRDARDRDTLAARVPIADRGRLHAVQADVTDAESVRRLFDEVMARHRRLDVEVESGEWAMACLGVAAKG